MQLRHRWQVKKIGGVVMRYIYQMMLSVWIVFFSFAIAAAEDSFLRNPEALCNIFEKNGLTLSEPWEQNNWRDYSCATAYYPLSKQSGVPTNIAFYAESEFPNEVGYMRLTLNINDDGLYKKGKEKFTVLSNRLLESLKIQQRQELLEHITEEKKHQLMTEQLIIKLEILKGATHTLRLIIEKRYGNS